MNSKLIIRDVKRKRAEELDLSNQDLSLIPDSVFGLDFLKVLDLSNNQLTMVEQKIDSLKELVELRLSYNNLTRLPEGVLRLPMLSKVDLRGNSFEGEFQFLNDYNGDLLGIRNKLKTVFSRKMKTFEEEFLDDDEFIFTPQKAEKENEKPVFSEFTQKSSNSGDKEVERLKAELKKLKEDKMVNAFGGTNYKVNQLENSDLYISSLKELSSLKQISQGGFSIIKKGVFRNCDVVVKCFFDPSNSVENKDEFKNEVKMLSRLRHPNIITMMAFHVSSNINESGIIFEYLKGGNLFEFLHLKKKKFNKHRFLLSLAKTVDYMHKSGVVHKDLKSLNILIDSQEEPKVIDFGLAKPIDQLNRGSKRYTATPSYSAPEIFLQKELTEKVDIYALGVLMWEILTNRVPFDGYSAAKIKSKVTSKESLDCRTIEFKYRKLVESCLSHDSRKRPSSSDVVDQLRKCT